MRITKIFFTMLIFLIVVNGYIFLNRNDFQFIKQSSYYDLYPNLNQISIKAFKIKNDSILQIQLNNNFREPVNWKIKKNANETVNRSFVPEFTLNMGVCDYTIKSPVFADSLKLKIEYYPDSFFKKINSDEQNRITIFRGNIPKNGLKTDLNKWKNNNIEISDTELIDLIKVLKYQISIKKHDGTYARVQKIAKYLCFYISNSKGTPTIKTKNLSVYQQYLAAFKGEKIDCGIYANIFCLFASRSKIINRIVELKHNYGTFNENIHVFNEYFMDETKQWATLDIMLNNIAYIDNNGQFMNAVQVKNQQIRNNGNYVLKSNILSNSKDSVLEIPFSKLSDDFNNLYYYDRDLDYYYTTDMKQVYSLFEKTKRYYSQNIWVEKYSDIKILNNQKFYLKQFFIATLLLFSLGTLNFYFIEKFTTKSQLKKK